jgi:formate-dependent nitrite reductase membrane component NrfD
MKEVTIISGRMNPRVDPHLEIWHWEIPFYLFMGGLAAGILFFAALYVLLNKEEKHAAAVKVTPHLAPVILILGLVALLLDLNHKAYFWQLYTTIRLQSPMSWGAWVLMLITPISFVWSAIHIRTILPNWEWKGWLKTLESFFVKQKRAIAWIMLFSSVILGIYTGILFSAFNARPLWNTSILGPLFLVSGLSTGAAMNILFSRDHAARLTFARIDLMLIGIELFLIVHMFMGFLASTQVQIDAAALFLGGHYTAAFWVLVVGLGLVLPAVLEILELKKYKIPVFVPAGLVLIGGLMLRFIIAYAGQESRWLY